MLDFDNETNVVVTLTLVEVRVPFVRNDILTADCENLMLEAK